MLQRRCDDAVATDVVLDGNEKALEPEPDRHAPSGWPDDARNMGFDANAGDAQRQHWAGGDVEGGGEVDGADESVGMGGIDIALATGERTAGTAGSDATTGGGSQQQPFLTQDA